MNVFRSSSDHNAINHKSIRSLKGISVTLQWNPSNLEPNETEESKNTVLRGGGEGVLIQKRPP